MCSSDLDTEDDGHYILQAMSEHEMTKWIDMINCLTNLAAKCHLIYLGSSPKPHISNHIHNPVVVVQDPRAGETPSLFNIVLS